MPSGKQAKRRRRQPGGFAPKERLKLPDGTSVDVPPRDHPGWDAIRRLQADEARPGDGQLVEELFAVSDMRYWAYMHAVGTGPRDVTDLPLGGDAVKKEECPPAVEKILRQFAEILGSGELGLCAHVRPRAPQPAIWTAWMPRKLRCPSCAAEADGDLKGTPADFKCDACGHIGKRITKLSLLTAPVELRQVMVPVLVLLALCNRCAGPDIVASQEARLAARNRA